MLCSVKVEGMSEREIFTVMAWVFIPAIPFLVIGAIAKYRYEVWLYTSFMLSGTDGSKDKRSQPSICRS